MQAYISQERGQRALKRAQALRRCDFGACHAQCRRSSGKGATASSASGMSPCNSVRQRASPILIVGVNCHQGRAGGHTLTHLDVHLQAPLARSITVALASRGPPPGQRPHGSRPAPAQPALRRPAPHASVSIRRACGRLPGIVHHAHVAALGHHHGAELRQSLRQRPDTAPCPREWQSFLRPAYALTRQTKHVAGDDETSARTGPPGRHPAGYPELRALPARCQPPRPAAASCWISPR